MKINTKQHTEWKPCKTIVVRRKADLGGVDSFGVARLSEQSDVEGLRDVAHGRDLVVAGSPCQESAVPLHLVLL